MANKTVHTQHVGSRLGFEVMKLRTGEIQGRGSMAYATIYGGVLAPDWQEWLDERRARKTPWILEWRHHNGQWLYDEATKRLSLADAMGLATNTPDAYRVSVRVEGSLHTYRPVKIRRGF